MKRLQLLGDFVPRPPTGASPLDPTGGLPSPKPPVNVLPVLLNFPPGARDATINPAQEWPTIRYDTIEEFNVDSKAEYTELSFI